MKVLIDTNIALTYLSGREDPYAKEARDIMMMCAKEEIDGALAFHSLSIIWYHTRYMPDEIRRDWIRQLCDVLTIAGADNEAILEAISDVSFEDFEDAMQDRCAVSFNANYIVTANIKDFKDHSIIPALTPTELLEKVAENQKSVSADGE